jgi:hypothetical protein
MRRSLTLSLLLLLGAGTAQATGPSVLNIQLQPLAARNGAVLFRTQWSLNPTGAHVFVRTEYGWLVVDARGNWEEAPHRTLEPEADGNGPWDESIRMNEEFKGPLNWDAPPASLAGLLRKYGFTAKDAVAADAGKGTVSWTPKALCKGTRCGAPCRQRSLRGLRSVAKEGEKVEAAFVHSGLALFHNSHTDPESDPNEGALFAESRSGQDLGLERIEYQIVSGLCRMSR